MNAFFHLRWFRTTLGIVTLLSSLGLAIPVSAQSHISIDPTRRSGGIVGRVTLGPSCPVVTRHANAACADRPYQTEMSIRTPNNMTEVATTPTDANGYFRLRLKPGEYLLADKAWPLAGGNTLFPLLPTWQQGAFAPQHVFVVAGQFTYITIRGDTGIRSTIGRAP